MIKFTFGKINKLQEKRLRVFGFLLLAMTFVDGVSGCLMLLGGAQFFGWIFIALAAGFGFVLLPLLLGGFPNAARVITPFHALVFMGLIAVRYGHESNVEFSAFIGAVYPFLVFRQNEYKLIFTSLLSPLFLILFLEANRFLFNEPTGVETSVSRTMLTLATFFIITAAIFLFARQSAIFERKLKKANNQLDILVRTICHDLSNPLMIAIGKAKILRKKIEEKDAIEVIIKANKHMSEIIDNVATLHQFNVGKLDLKNSPVVLFDAIKDSEFSLSNKIESKKITIKINIDQTEDIRIFADKSVLSMSVFANILSNAIKFSPQGSQIEINSEFFDDDHIDVLIRDFGVGIPNKILTDIFNPYVPTTRRGTDNEKGTGFGLPLVKTYMEAMGGSITVKTKTIEECSNDHGTLFVLRFRSATFSRKV